MESAPRWERRGDIDWSMIARQQAKHEDAGMAARTAVEMKEFVVEYDGGDAGKKHFAQHIATILNEFAATKRPLSDIDEEFDCRQQTVIRWLKNPPRSVNGAVRRFAASRGIDPPSLWTPKLEKAKPVTSESLKKELAGFISSNPAPDSIMQATNFLRFLRGARPLKS